MSNHPSWLHPNNPPNRPHVILGLCDNEKILYHLLHISILGCKWSPGRWSPFNNIRLKPHSGSGVWSYHSNGIIWQDLVQRCIIYPHDISHADRYIDPAKRTFELVMWPLQKSSYISVCLSRHCLSFTGEALLVSCERAISVFWLSLFHRPQRI